MSQFQTEILGQMSIPLKLQTHSHKSPFSSEGVNHVTLYLTGRQEMDLKLCLASSYSFIALWHLVNIQSKELYKCDCINWLQADIKLFPLS